jgi:hypothetical protein
MARKMPNFNGFTLADIEKANGNVIPSIAIDKEISANVEDSNAINRNVKNNIAKKSNDKNNTAKDEGKSTTDSKRKIDIDDTAPRKEAMTVSLGSVKGNIDKDNIAINSNANIGKPQKINQALFSAVRDHLYKLLGDGDSAEVKFAEVVADLDINPHSFYKYLRILRETDFIVKQLRYSTEIRRR